MNGCILTGCALHIPAEGKWSWGDLHGEGDARIFVGNSWEVTPVDNREKTVTLEWGASYFERSSGRQVIVVIRHPTLLLPNQAVRDYLRLPPGALT